LPLGFHGWAVRVEAAAIGSYNTDKTAGEDKTLYADYHVTAGLQIPLGSRTEPSPAPPPPPACATTQDPLTGKKSCVSDEDHDGVVDMADQCPGTPAGTPVDRNGCPAPTGDADGDGVANANDACPGTAPGLKVDGKGCALPQTTILQGIKFAYASAELEDSSIPMLDALVSTLRNQPGLRAQIAGYTDSNVRDPERNRELSLDRAQAVYSYLVAHGIAADRLTAAGYGDARPIASNDTLQGRALNRRVELTLTGQ
jgi:OOP family OmpA-OmpF porin